MIKDFHIESAKKIFAKIKNRVEKEKIVVSIAGESGCGKSEIAYCLAKNFQEGQAVILCQDDYFKLPPQTNHQNRLKSLDNVGTKEVLLDKLDEHLLILKKMSAPKLVKPLVDFENDKIGQEVLDVGDFALIIVEGTYTSLLQNVDFRCFIDKSYLQTKKNRQLRGRDPISEFVEKVLQIEHKQIVKHKKLADIVL